MKKLTPIQLGSRTLNKPWRFDFGIYSFKEAIDQGKFVAGGCHETDNMGDYNRRHFNRLDREGQEKYMKKLEKVKMHYWLKEKVDQNYTTTCSATVYKYFMQQAETPPPIINEAGQISLF